MRLERCSDDEEKSPDTNRTKVLFSKGCEDSMADGYLNFDTKINEAGFNKGISKLSNIAQTGLGVVIGNIATSAVQKIGQLGSELVAGLNESSAAWKTFQANMQMNGKTADEISKIQPLLSKALAVWRLPLQIQRRP